MLVRTETALTYAGARVALDAALAHAEAIGGAFNIAVTDTAGGLLAFARMDGAFAVSGSIAQDKAWTVAGFGGLPTDVFYDAISGEDAVREGIGQRGRVAAFGGGVPVARRRLLRRGGRRVRRLRRPGQGCRLRRRRRGHCRPGCRTARRRRRTPTSTRGRTMTPFMLRVAELVGTPEEDLPDVEEIAPMPDTRISRRIATGTGADRQVAIRSLAEQLVSEANAILAESDDRLGLVDETLPHELAFRVTHRDRAARVSTTFEDGTAYGRLVGDGFDSELPQELDGPDALPDLIVRLLVESGVTHHHVP